MIFWEEVLVLVRRSSNVDLYHDDLVGIITCTTDVGNVFSYLGPLLLLAAPLPHPGPFCFLGSYLSTLM